MPGWPPHTPTRCPCSSFRWATLGERDGVFPHFSSVQSFASVTKSVEQLKRGDGVVETLRRAFARLKMGRPGPVMVEIPSDVVVEEVDDSVLESYRPVKATVAEGNPHDVYEAAKALLEADHPIIHAGQGVLYADATPELVELAELIDVPVMTTMAGKGAMPENHPLALGSGSGVMSGPVFHFLGKADLVFGIGTSFTRHGMVMPIHGQKLLIHATNDPIDIGKNYSVEHPIIGDAKLVLRQFIDACTDLRGARAASPDGSVAEEIATVRQAWLDPWQQKLTSNEVPITPYRVVGEFMANVDPTEAIVTHDSGSPRDQIMPFYRSGGPRT